MCLIGETSVINEAKPPNINVYCSPHLQRGYNGVERADSQLPGTAIQIVFAVCSYRWRGSTRQPRTLDNQTVHSFVNNDSRQTDRKFVLNHVFWTQNLVSVQQIRRVS
jgi:hypothetical protein